MPGRGRRFRGGPGGKGSGRSAARVFSDDDHIQLDGVSNALVNVGQRLRELRAASGLSIRVLAEMSGLAINTLSLIENNKTSPSVSTLQQLADALQVPITSFFEPNAEERQVIFTKRAERPSADFDGMSLEDLGAGLYGRVVQPLVVRLDEGSGSGDLPIIHTGHEFVYCMNGSVVYSIEGTNYTLEQGDSLLFEAHLPHIWRNPGPDAARIMLILFRSDNHDRLAMRHFGLDGNAQ